METFRVLFTEPCGYLRLDLVTAETFEEVEIDFVARHPKATWWEVSLDAGPLLFPTPWTV